MYFPKSHITPNLYSNGELSLIGSNTTYIGYYFTVLNGKAYTGRYPNDGENLELTTPNSFNGEIENIEEGDSFYDYRFTTPNNVYSELNKTPQKSTNLKPNPFYPSPTQQDYELGEFTRYFCKKVNEEIYYETRKTFKNVLYIGFSIPWSIIGDKDTTFKLNKNIVNLKEQQLNISGLGAFLKFNYLQFHK